MFIESVWIFLLALVVVFLADVVLAFVTWLLVDKLWNNIVRKELQVESDKAWACLLVSVVLVINAVTIVLLVWF